MNKLETIQVFPSHDEGELWYSENCKKCKRFLSLDHFPVPEELEELRSSGRYCPRQEIIDPATISGEIETKDLIYFDHDREIFGIKLKRCKKFAH